MKIKFICQAINTLGGVSTGDREVSLTAVAADAQQGGIKATGGITLSLSPGQANQLVKGQSYVLELNVTGNAPAAPPQPEVQASAGVSASLDEHNQPINPASPPPSSNTATQRQVGPEQSLGPRLPNAPVPPTVTPVQADGAPSSEGTKEVKKEAAPEAKPAEKHPEKAPAKADHKGDHPKAKATPKKGSHK